MTDLNVGIHMHEAPGFLDPELGPCVTLDRHYDPPLLGTFDGVAGNLERCRAITEARRQCPKPGAVALLVNGLWEMVCGGHYGVHHRGVRLLELVQRPDRP